jgi:hypothetical protein
MLMVRLSEVPGKEETYAARYPEAKKIYKACHRFLTHDYPKTPGKCSASLRR